MPPRTRAGAAGGGDGDDEPTLLSIVELNKLFKDVVIFTPQSGVHDANKALFRAWTRSIMLHAPVLEIVGRHAKADFGDIYDGEWAKIDQSERPQAEHMLAYFLKTKTAATAASLVRSLASKGADAKEMFVKLAKMYGTYNDQGVSIRKQLAALSMRTLGGPTELGTPRHQAGVIDDLKAAFPMTEGGEDYLGLQFQIEPGRVRVHQAEYASKICAKFGFARSSSVKTPLSTDWNAGNTEQPSGGRPGRITRENMDSALGAIGYLATRTMPWLSFAFGVLSTVARATPAFPDHPTPGALSALGRVFRYVNSHAQLGLTYTRCAEFALDGYMDASHGREIHRTASGVCRSRSGGYIFACGASVCAWSSVQYATAISTFEAELYALVVLVRVLLSMRSLASFMLKRSLRPSHVYCDNESAILFLRGRDLSARARHIRCQLGFLYDALDSGELVLHHVPSKFNPANTLTAAEDEDRFRRSLAMIAGLRVNDRNELVDLPLA